jgi:CubicO group peptidase (beta-lactamase class C family)
VSKKVINIGYTFFLLILLGCINQDNNGQQDFSYLSVVKFDKEETFSTFLEKVRVYYKLPAIAAAVVTSDSILCLDAVGINNTKDSVEVDQSSKFNLGSCAKSFTSLLVAKFVGLEVIGLDTKLIDVITDERESIYSNYYNISVTDLLSHSSGFPQYYTDEDFFNFSDRIPGISGSLMNQRKKFTIWNLQNRKSIGRGEYNYSNGGYVAVASMLESISDKSWEELINEEIIQPLGLSSAIIGFAQDYDRNQPWRHYHRDINGFAIPLNSSERKIPNLFNPAGNISMSIRDFAKYAQCQLKVLFEDDTTFIDPQLVKYLHQPIVNISENESYGLGWVISMINGGIVSAHSGGDQSTYAVIAIDHNLKKAWVIFTNVGDSQAELACGNIIMETQKK